MLRIIISCIALKEFDILYYNIVIKHCSTHSFRVFFYPQLLVGFVVASLVVLIYCSDVGQSATYQDVIHAMCGRAAQLACSIAVVVYTFGTCITFFIVIGDQWDKCKCWC